MRSGIVLAAAPASGRPHKAQGERGNTTTGEEGRPAPTFLYTSGLKNFLHDPTGDRRFWPVEVKASGLAAESNDDAGATTSPLREGQADASGLTAEGYEAAAASPTTGEQQAGAEKPKPAGWHFNRMLQQLGGKPA